jgi:hypothetical protein
MYYLPPATEFEEVATGTLFQRELVTFTTDLCGYQTMIRSPTQFRSYINPDPYKTDVNKE